MTEKKILATFKIDESAWIAFKDKCDKAGNSASYELQQFIFSSIGRNPQQPGAQRAFGIANSIDIESSIENYLESNRESLIGKYLEPSIETILDEKMGQYISGVDSRLDGFESINQELLGKIEAIREENKSLREKLGAIGTSQIAETGINKATLSPIFDDGAAVDNGDKPYVYGKEIEITDRPPFPADGLMNNHFKKRYGIAEATARGWARSGKYIVHIAAADETIRYSPDDKKWFEADSTK